MSNILNGNKLISSHFYYLADCLPVLLEQTSGCLIVLYYNQSSQKESVSILPQKDLQAVIADTEITAEFASAEETVKGSAGCNSYFGSYKLKGSQLSIPGPIGATEMYCMEPEGVMDQEQEYLAVLQLAESYEIDGDKLQINCGSQVLIFKSD